MSTKHIKGQSSIGVFDSGYGGLTVLAEIKKLLPEYNYIYLGDNMRAPYGNRSYETVYQFTQDAVSWLFEENCQLVILACNTASAKALRTIQQKYLPHNKPEHRVLGVIRPTVESIVDITQTKHVGILGTTGTIKSKSYEIEIEKMDPNIKVIGEDCPMWVPLVENLEHDKPGADYFVKKHMENILLKDSKIDTIVLACTHYPLLIEKIRQCVPDNVNIITQGYYVADKLKDYLKRHPEIEACCAKEGETKYYTTDSTVDFNNFASLIINESIDSKKIQIKSSC